MASPVLEVKNLSKRFGSLAATDDVSVALHAGEIHALIGPNGAGKSTLIGQIVGEIESDSGTILFEGKPIDGFSPARRARLGLARSCQVSSVIPEFTARENLVLAAQGVRKRTNRFFRNALADRQLLDVAHRQLRRVGMEGRIDIRAESLSHGERRRLEMAMALALRPKVLLLDEPMAGIGTESIEMFGELLDQLRQEAPILLIEHDMETVFALADRISVLVYGRIIASGTPDDIRANRDVRATYLGEDT